MSQAIAPGLIPPRPGLEREEPELATEHDIPPQDDTAAPPEETPAMRLARIPKWWKGSDQSMSSEPAMPPAPTPSHAPKPVDPEPLTESEATDPEKGRVKNPEPGKSEHPTD